MAHVDPLLDTYTMQQQFACRQPCFAKLEQAMKHTAKANTFIAKLKVTYFGAGASSSAVSGSVSNDTEHKWEWAKSWGCSGREHW